MALKSINNKNVKLEPRYLRYLEGEEPAPETCLLDAIDKVYDFDSKEEKIAYIAESYGLSDVRVRNIIAEAFKKLICKPQIKEIKNVSEEKILETKKKLIKKECKK